MAVACSPALLRGYFREPFPGSKLLDAIAATIGPTPKPTEN
jgi:hypothetical protein